MESMLYVNASNGITNSNDIIYIMTDGIVDFYRIMQKPDALPSTLRMLFSRLSSSPVPVQKRYIEFMINQALKQSIPVDDLTILGLKML
jgi:serine phosphatase RsbU (regulator of sigma subunit)